MIDQDDQIINQNYFDIQKDQNNQQTSVVNSLKDSIDYNQNIDQKDSRNQILQSKVTKSPFSMYAKEKTTQGDNILSSEQIFSAQTTTGGFVQQMSIFANRRWKYVASFIQKMKQQSSTYRFTLSRKPQLDLIDDQSFNYNYFYYQDKFLFDVSFVNN